MVATSHYIFAQEIATTTEPVYEYQTINIFPGQVQSVGWENPYAALVQDENENSLFGSFTKTTSATLKKFVENVVETTPATDGNEETVSPDGTSSETVPTEDTDGTTDQTVDDLSSEGNSNTEEASTEETVLDPVQQEENATSEAGTEAQPETTPEVSAEPISSRVIKMVNEVYAFAVGVFSSSTVSEPVDIPTTQIEDEIESEEIVVPVQEEEQTDVVVPTESPTDESASEPVPVEIVATSSVDAVPQSISESGVVFSESNNACEVENCFKHILEFSDFNVGDGFDLQQITNMQLRVSLGALPNKNDSPSGKIRIEYEHYDYWIDGGTIEITDELSNAINGGYYLFGFPLYVEWEEMKRIKVRFTYESDNENLPEVYIDSVWLEVESIDGNAFNEPVYAPTEPVDPDADLRREGPAGYELEFLHTKTDFTIDEAPNFKFKIDKAERKQKLLERVGTGVLGFFGVEPKKKERPMHMRVVNKELKYLANVVESENGEFELEIKKPRQFTPGTHVVTVEVTDENGSFFIDQRFTWGVLAINTDKSMYFTGERPYLQFGVLDDTGHTICDAQLDLEITSPNGDVTQLSTQDGSINYSEDCIGDTFTTTPDYDANYRIVDRIGAYTMKLTATTPNGVHTITDSFEVREAIPFEVKRTGPTRIYPPELYPVTLSVTANQDYAGKVIEYVPLSFQVYEDEDSEKTFRTHEVYDGKQLIWDVSLKAGEKLELAYMFDAPDISPEFYLLGPLEIGEFKEIRQWQIASDAPDPAVIVQSVMGTEVSGTTFTATFGSAPASGNTIIMAAMTTDNPVTFNTPANLTPAIVSNAAVEIDIGIWYGSSNPASSTYTITKTGGAQTGIVYLMEVSGLNTASPLNVTASNNQTGTNSRTASTSPTAVSAASAFAFAAIGFADNDFTAPTTASWSSWSTNAYTQRNWYAWATGNDGSLGIATANVKSAAAQGATLTVTGGGSTEQRNSVLAVFNLAPQVTTVGSVGNQTSQLKLGVANQHVGGAFTFVPSSGTTTVTSVSVNEAGTVNAQNDLSNIRLKYELDTTAPYNCASVSYNGTESQFGATSTSFSASNGTSTFNGSVAFGTSSALCMYPVMDIDSSASHGQTLELQMTKPSTGVTTGAGTVTPATAVTISDTTTIVIGFAPGTPRHAATPLFESYRATSTTPRLGGISASDVDGDALEYSIIIDDDYDLLSPATTTYSSHYPGDSGWSATTFTQNATTTYRVPASVGLTAGQTYWYAVRARDPSNSNTWSATSTPRSFTISSSITVPEWYQTTFEQFDQGTFSNAIATSSGAVVIASTTQSFNWLTTPVDVSPGTAGSWQTVDVSAHVPAGATGVILRWDISNSGADRALGFRHGDSTDNRFTTVEVEKSDWAFAGLNSSRQFDAYVGANSVDVYLMGYTTNGVTFFTNSSNKTLSANSTWEDVSIAADTGADTAIGVIVEVVHATNNDTWGIRKNGSTDNRTGAYGRYHNWAIMGVDGSEIFEAWANDRTDTTFHVIGYVTSGATFFTNGIDRTPSAGVGFVDTDITGNLLPGDNAIGAFVEVYGTAGLFTYGLRRNGDASIAGGIQEQAKRHAWGIVAVDDDDIYEAALEASSLYTNNLIGYATEDASGSITSDPVDFDHVPNQTDWGEISWSVTEPAGTDTVMQVYYGSTCSTIVPNAALAGNSTGFTATSSPINISGLSTSTYNNICLKVTLDQGTASESPSLNNWGISWVQSPVLNQETYKWYVNANTNTPTDIWPSGVTDLALNEAINATNPTKTNDVVRLRMAVGVSSVAATGRIYKLQYAEGLTCDATLAWADVGAIGSTTALWRGYNNAGVSDGATLASLLLTGSDVLETYEEQNDSTALPNTISTSQSGEFDWVLENKATPGTSYCFRMVTSDGTPFATYTEYPQLVTNSSPSITSSDTPFNNEKVAVTNPPLEFSATDPEEEDVDYQVQIDNDSDFSSTIIDTSSASNLTDFLNVDTPADKSPFTHIERIRYSIPSSLTNGTTYWWRVRSRDLNGSGQYGEWMDPQSFTIDTSVTIATWHQTTEEQFDTDTLIDTDATASDLVTMLTTTVATATSPTIDFDDADTGNAWGTLTWTDNESTGDIKYHIEYFNGSSWARIPDSDLPGNSTGFDTSGVVLIDLDTETYNQIRIQANFTYSGGSPTLSDWTVTWGERVSVVTHLSLFDNEKTATTTPTFTFTTTDPQGNDLQYQFSYSTDNTFTAGTTTRNSNVDPGFANITSVDSDPFNSGDTISYKIQSALTNGTTYWWRVRAKDVNNGNSYSFWSDPQSFTVDTSINVSTWFQTTQEQFDTNSLTGVIASTSDSLSMLPPGVATYNFVGVTNPSATHVGRDFEVDVLDPTDPPSVDAVDTLTTTGTTGGAPNLRQSIAGYASDAQATNAQYTSIATSDNSRWQITDPGAGDNAIFWASFHIDESPNDVNQIDVLLEGYQGGVPPVGDKGWLAIWRPGASTPYWQALSYSTRTGDFNYTGSLTSNVDEYIDSSNNVYIMFFNEDDSDSLFVDYVEVEVTSGAASEGVAYSSPIDYNDGTGPAWGSFSWTDSTPGSSNILYQLQYLNTLDVWTLVPDGVLTGNSTGFTTSPIDLQALNTTTYNEVRLVGNFDCVGINCPTMNDWALNWSEGFDISGTAVDYAGTASTTSGTVGVAVNGVLQAGKTGSILANGTWTITNVTFYAGDVITVFVSGAADADEAVAVTTFDGTPDITGMKLQKRHLTIGSNDYATIDNADIGEYDFTDDEDLFFDVNVGSDLDMCATTGCFDAGIVILPRNTYSAGSGADAITYNLRIDGTYIPGSNTVRVFGSWDNNATTTMTGSTLIFTSTTSTQTIDQTGALTTSFNNVTFGEGSGAATWNLVTTLDIDGNLEVTYGTLNRNLLPLTIAGNLSTGANGYWSTIGTTTFDGVGVSTWSDANATKQNIGRVVSDGTSKTLRLGSDTLAQSMFIGSNDTLDLSSSNYDVTVYRNWINNNTFTPQQGTVFFAATSTGRIITAGGDNFYDVTFSGVGGAWSFTESTLGVSNDFAITAANTVTLPTGTTTIAGSFTNSGGTFVHNNGQLYFTSASAETLTLGGTAFTNAFYNARFTGSGSWTFTEANATTSNLFRITQGNVTLPSNTLTVGDTFTNSAGTFAHNSGTVKFINTGTKVIDTNSSFGSLLFSGSGSSFSFLDSSVTAVGNLTVTAGTLTLPSSTFTLGGSLTNSATLAHNSGTVLFNATAVGRTINLGNSSLYNMTFSGGAGGWTISENATTTNNTTLTAAGVFTLASGKKLSVGGTFTNSVGGASTTWTGSTLSLEAGAYTLNTKTNTGDAYDVLRVDANTDIKMWNSSASTYTIDATGSLYSQDHNGSDGDLYIFGNYPRTSGTEYWSSAYDFDGTSLGGSARQVDVRFASGASASFSNSIVHIVGSSSASTTIANQGSGTYVVGISGGTTTASYYNFENLGTTGLSLSNANQISSLAHGRFVPGIGGGTGLTVSSTTIDANPALQINYVHFSTTTSIAATNVTQSDGTPSSYWWFRNSSGNLDGEAYDADTGNPGSIRWDDSAITIEVSGVVYSDDGVTPLVGGTCNGIATPVRVVVNNGASYTGSCSNVDGSFNILGVSFVGDPTLTVYLDSASGGEKAVTVTKTPTADITNLDLYVNRVITRHEDAEAMTISDMAIYDHSNDTDIQFSASTSTIDTLTTFANTELFVWATTTFTPGGTVTLNGNATGNTYDGTLHIAPGATFIASSSATTSIAGNFVLDTNATFTHASGTVVMTATTSGKAITVASGETLGLNLLRFIGSNGAWNLSGSINSVAGIEIRTGTVTGTANISIPYGSFYGNGLLSLGSGTTTLSRTNTLGGTQGWTFANLVLGNALTVGTTTPASVATTTIGGKLTIQTGHYLDAGSSIFNLSGAGTVFVENGSLLQDTSTILYSGVAATNILSTSYYNLKLQASAGSPTYTTVGSGIIVANELTVGGPSNTTVNVNTNDTPLDVNGNLTIASNGTLIASNSGTFTVAGNWDNNGTFTHSSGSITFDGGGTPSIAAGNSWFNNVTINGAGAFSITEHATSSGAFSLTSASGFALQSGQTLAVGGVFTNGVGGGATTWTGSTLRLYSGTNYQINAKTIADTYDNLSVGVNTDIRMWNSSAASYSVDATGSLYSQDHNDVAGDLYVYGNYPGNGTTDYWSYATDFDGASLGGSSRQVDVRFASGASMTMTSGGLQVLGTAAASTSLQNQGSGTYGLRIGGTASTSWSYYDVEDTNSAGLTFSGTARVVSLSYGDYEVSQGAGSAITVGGTVINANTARTFTNNTFSTTTGISAFNVTATGTALSSWRFTNHQGTIDGEGRDVDPDGDPGYIVWDDSSANVTISGNVYSDEGSAVSTVCDSSTQNIHLRVAGLTSYTTSCNGNGAGVGTGLYTISGVTYSPGDSLVIYIDGETEKGAVVSEDLVSSVSNMHIYENRVIVRHEGSDSLSIDDMAVYDSSDDADVPFTAVSGSPDTLTLPANRKLLVWTDKEFEPGGNVTLSGGGGGAAYDGTFEAQTNAIVTFSGAQAHSIGGSFILGLGATFDAGLSTTTFTTSGATRTIDSNDEGFYNAAFTGSGSWTITDSILDVNNVYITNGTLTLPTGTTTVASSWNNNGGSFVINGSTMVFTATGSGKVVRGGGSNFEELRFTGIGGSWSMTDVNATSTGAVTIAAGTVSLPSGIFAVGGNFRNEGGTITHNTSELVLTNTSATTLKANASNLYAVTFNGAGPFTLSDNSLTLVDSFRILQGSVTLATSTLSIGGSWTTTGGTFNHASGTILFNASATGKTIASGNSNFYNVVFGSASGGWTISGNATTTRNFTLTTATSFTQASSTRLYVGNVFTNSVGGAATTWTGSTLVLGSGSEYEMNSKSVSGDHYQTLVVSANTDISSWNSRATTTNVANSASFYSQDHAAVNGALRIYGDYHIATSTEYWSYATDFDGTSISGSPRAVTVSLASNATTSIDGGALHIVGTSGNETVISNQGSGTYALLVSEGTFDASYYEIRNLNSNGLVFTGAPSISSLSYGDFELAVNGGTLITLASSTLNANASMIHLGNRFATTTAITGTNIELIGTTSNAWTFTAHTGNLAGEAYDIDGIDACGSIRFDDSACLLTQQTHYRWRNNDGAIGVPNSEWFNGNWNIRKSVQVDNGDATTYTNAAVKIDVTYDSDMQADFDDLRFTSDNGTTLLSHFTERYTPSTDATVWVEIPSLEASETSVIYMYYGHGTASSTSSSTRTFIVADDFEDGTKSEYSGTDTTLFAVDSTFAYGGSYGLEASGDGNNRTLNGGIYNTAATASQGQTIRYLQYIDTTGGSGDEACTLFGVQAARDNYAVCLEQVSGTDRMSIAEDVQDTDISGTVHSSTTVSYTTGWYEVEIDWQTDDDIYVTLSQNGSLVATTSANDSTYTSGGIGFAYWYQHGGWDNYSARPTVTSEPSIRFGQEQQDGGASWKEALDTAATYVIDDVARLRFAVENTGLQITNQTFDLEFAPKGAAPSCEAVSGGSYVEVPPHASCGSSELCMATSTYITNGSPVSDLLLGPALTFILGEQVEDPSNTTDALTLEQDEYTEVEYALTPTVNATDGAYCLRVTDASDPLDTYLKVAELQMRFDPTVTNVSLNGGQPISLLPGATTTVYATGTATDLNGYADLELATSTIYRSGAGPACNADNNDCYISGGAPQCTFTACSGISCTVSCSADFYYHADATDATSLYPGEMWEAFIEVSDEQGGMDIGSASGVELYTLRGLDVTTNSIGYGTLAPASTTGSFNPTTTVRSLSNVPIDISIEGTDLSDGATSIIPVNEQIFSTTTFVYTGCPLCSVLSSTTPVALEVDLTKPTSTSTPITDIVYWGIEIPAFGIRGAAHTGTNIFYPVSDD